MNKGLANPRSPTLFLHKRGGLTLDDSAYWVTRDMHIQRYWPPAVSSSGINRVPQNVDPLWAGLRALDLGTKQIGRALAPPESRVQIACKSDSFTIASAFTIGITLKRCFAKIWTCLRFVLNNAVARYDNPRSNCACE